MTLAEKAGFAAEIREAEAKYYTTVPYTRSSDEDNEIAKIYVAAEALATGIKAAAAMFWTLEHEPKNGINVLEFAGQLHSDIVEQGLIAEEAGDLFWLYLKDNLV